MNVNETQCVENEVCMHNEITLYCILYECEIVQLVPAVLFDHVGQLNYKLALPKAPTVQSHLLLVSLDEIVDFFRSRLNNDGENYFRLLLLLGAVGLSRGRLRTAAPRRRRMLTVLGGERSRRRSPLCERERVRALVRV